MHHDFSEGGGVILDGPLICKSMICCVSITPKLDIIATRPIGCGSMLCPGLCMLLARAVLAPGVALLVTVERIQQGGKGQVSASARVLWSKQEAHHLSTRAHYVLLSYTMVPSRSQREGIR